MIQFKKNNKERTYFSVFMQWRYGGTKTTSAFDAISLLRHALEVLDNDKSDLYFDEVIDKGIVPSVLGTFSQTIFYPYIIIKRNYWEDKIKSSTEKIKLKNNKQLILKL